MFLRRSVSRFPWPAYPYYFRILFGESSDWPSKEFKVSNTPSAQWCRNVSNKIASNERTGKPVRHPCRSAYLRQRTRGVSKSAYPIKNSANTSTLLWAWQWNDYVMLLSNVSRTISGSINSQRSDPAWPQKLPNNNYCILQLFPMSSAYWSEMNFLKFSTSNRSCCTPFILDLIASTSSDTLSVSFSSSSIEVAEKENQM